MTGRRLDVEVKPIALGLGRPGMVEEEARPLLAFRGFGEGALVEIALGEPRTEELALQRLLLLLRGIAEDARPELGQPRRIVRVERDVAELRWHRGLLASESRTGDATSRPRHAPRTREAPARQGTVSSEEGTKPSVTKHATDGQQQEEENISGIFLYIDRR
jgi:hypothetical protein